VSKKLPECVIARVIELFFDKHLPVGVIKQRLGCSERAIFYILADEKRRRAPQEAPVATDLAVAA
jgi:hypothetical protein